MLALLLLSEKALGDASTYAVYIKVRNTLGGIITKESFLGNASREMSRSVVSLFLYLLHLLSISLMILIYYLIYLSIRLFIYLFVQVIN
jgi:hypothetical protein